ncbi:NACHT domain-containing protein [Salegentibacter sp. LM13S]|uniref:NACHT domain-containing protein n=1 Tax=Salegentibacter lacus TaxID=2873599 RepID=UPI001CCC34EF|nr:NACHT domain-containing protein [Salegentibacter lacus]MBZ9631735.1 NACHT domain-containing protein [Salegentibacter lacus]
MEIKKRKIQDADISSAGDDFHILWTIKKSLELLNFDDFGIKAINIESVELSESEQLDPTGKNLLGVDLSEYYGADNYNEAEKVVISQLKYSTLRRNKNYTIGELYIGKKSKSTEGSLIHRLANIFKLYLDEFGRESVLNKVRIKLVTNRSFNPNHLKSINNIKTYLLKKKGKISFNVVLKDNPQNSTSLEKLFLASRLKVTEFTDFIRLLDLEDCGTDSRLNLKFQLYEAISRTTYTSKIQYNQLRELVSDKMMPEARSRRKITVTDIIASLGFNDGSIENLFPVSQNLEDNKNSIIREQLESIISKIAVNTDFIPICLHGGAGIGKSTIVQQIQKYLPDSNECLIFDCYGSGSYQNAEDRRHLHKNALLHISNEIAKKVGTDFLIINIPQQSDVYIKEFRKRIVSAIEILKQRDVNATLTIIIDAADNSITAATNNGDKSFVQDILDMNIPVGCNLIVTTRTHRKESLNLPEDYIDIELEPFSLAETTQFIKKYFPNILEKEIKDFHKYTHGIPRAQFYSIDLKKNGIKEVINFLKPNGKTVESLILDKIKEAKRKVSKEEKIIIDDFFKLLIALPRPVPINYLSEILNVSQSFLFDISSEVWNGLIYENNSFEFRDEDFENYIRDNYLLRQEKLKEVTEFFFNNAENDSYASVNLGSLLFQSKQNQLLKDIVLERKFLLLPEDPIKNRETYISRTRLAMKVANSGDDNLTYFKLIFIAAEEAKKEKALTELLINYPDLVAVFGDDTSLNKLKLNSDEKSWAGSFHMKLAGVYSRESKWHKTALKHLKTAKEWLNWRRDSVKKEDLHKYPISSKDIAFFTEAVLRLVGADEALRSINSWRPKDVRLSGGNYLIENLFLFSHKTEIDKLFQIELLRIDAKIFVVTKAFKHKVPQDFELNIIASEIEKILCKKIIKFNIAFRLIIVDFCEILIFNDIDKILVKSILNHIKYESPKYVPSFYRTHGNDDEANKLNLYLKAKSLKAFLDNELISVENILPDKFLEIDKIKDREKQNSLESEKKKFSSFYNHILPIFQLNIDFISKKITIDEATKKFTDICEPFSKDYSFRYENGHSYKEKLNYFASLLANFVVKINRDDLIEVLIKSFDINAAKIAMRFWILEETIHVKDFLNRNLKILNEIEELIKTDSNPSSQIIESYIKCALISRKIDFNSGKHYFNEAINATEEIDFEAFSKISCLSDLAKVGFEKNDPKLAHQYSRFTEYSDFMLDGYDKKHFPYKDALLGIADIHFNSMFTTASRWHHRDVINISKHIVAILKVSLEKGNIDHNVAASLIPMYQYKYYTDELMKLYDLILSKYDESRDLLGKTKFIELVYRNCLLHKDKDTLNHVYNAIKSGAFVELQIIQKIESYLNFRKTVEKEKEGKYTNDFNKEKFSHEIDLNSVNLNSTRDLEKAISTIIENNDSYSNRWKIDNFLSEIKNNCLPKDYVNQLDAIVDIDSELLSFYSFEDAIRERLEEWSYYPSLKQWKKERFRYVVLTWFENFDYGNSLSIGKLLEFAKMFDFDEIQLGEVILSVLPEKIEILTDESIYSVFFLIKHRLTKKDNTEIFKWVLPKWNKNIKVDFRDGLWNEKLLPPSHTDEAIANILRLYLGLPDKELRWEAIHCIRRLVNLDNKNILKNLIELQNKTNCIPFQNEEFIFYWISAKLYLWIAIDRLSAEIPEKLIDLKEEFFKELQNNKLPHVLINFFIKRTCQNLLKYDENVYNEEECEIIQDILVSKLDKVKEDSYSREQRKYNPNPDKNWRFDFDSMDVLPYWYSNLGDIFNLSQYDIADIADKYIVEKWGYTGDINKDDYTRNYDWGLRDKRHGTNPQVESLDTYFEYHAMYCAANELLENEPQLVNYYDDEDDWDSWLKSKAITWDGFWISDLRDPLPLLDKFWKNEYREFNKGWRDTINEEKFDREIGFSEFYNDRFIIPHGGFTRYIGDNSESVYIRSALVSLKGSEALLRAFQSAEDQHEYGFPIENDRERFEINNDGLIYKSWLKENRTDYDGLDVHDSLGKNGSKSIITLGADLQKSFQIKFSKNLKIGKQNHKEISLFELWDETNDSRYRNIKNIESSGEILKVDINFILEMLKNEKMNMILKCQITKQLKDSEYRVDNRKQPWEHTKIYLLKADGTVKTLRGRNFKIR